MSEARRHFEVVCNDLDKIAGLAPRTVRARVKDDLIARGFVKASTTELDETELERIAELLGKLVTRHEGTPPDERGIIDIALIIKTLQ